MYGIGSVGRRRARIRFSGLGILKNATAWKAFIVMALCARARVGPGITPFAAAYFASRLDRDEETPFMLAGCAAGAFATGFDAASLFAPAACALALIFYLLFEVIGRKIPRLRMDTGSRAALTAGLAVLLPALASAGYSPGMWLVSLAAAVCAAVTAPLMMAEHVWWGAQARMAVGACALTLAVAGFGIDCTPVAALCAVTAGAAGRGALMGAILGSISALTGGGAMSFAAVSIMGAASDAVPNVRGQPFWRVLAGCTAYAMLMLWPDMKFDIWLMIAVCGHVLIPERWLENIAGCCSPPVRRDRRLLAALRRRDEARLRALSDAFSTLSEACGAGDPAFGEQQLITRMRSALCAGCPQYSKCWPGSNSGAIKLFCQLMTSAIECGGSPFNDGEVPPDIMRLCRRGMTVPARLGNMLADFAVQRHRRIRLMEARRLLAGQFRQTAEVLNTMAQEQSRPFAMRDGAAAHVKQALKEEGLPVRDVMALKMDSLEVNVALNGRWSREKLDRAARVISIALDRPYILQSTSADGSVFVPGGTLHAVTAASSLPADPDHPCGDSSLIRTIDGKVLVAISDGMGSGEAAAEESRRVISLMHSLISAGLPRELALSTINGVLLSRGGEELFATADLLMLDLETGHAEFTKLAASRSYIVRGRSVHVVEGGRLPLGILDEVRPGVQYARLRKGDVVFMMTDGVVDAINEDALSELMVTAADSGEEDMARFIVDAAAMRAPVRRDDMTAVCIRIA